jgi:hypothetical protein
MRKSLSNITPALFAACFLILSGCAVQRFQLDEGNPDMPTDERNSGIPTYEGQSHFLLGGIWQTKTINAGDFCGYDQISSVETYSSAIDIIFNALTFSIYAPRSYSIYCRENSLAKSDYNNSGDYSFSWNFSSSQRFQLDERNPDMPTYEGKAHFFFAGGVALNRTKTINAGDFCGYDQISSVESYLSTTDAVLTTLTLSIYTPRSYSIYCKEDNLANSGNDSKPNKGSKLLQYGLGTDIALWQQKNELNDCGFSCSFPAMGVGLFSRFYFTKWLYLQPGVYYHVRNFEKETTLPEFIGETGLDYAIPDLPGFIDKSIIIKSVYNSNIIEIPVLLGIGYRPFKFIFGTLFGHTLSNDISVSMNLNTPLGDKELFYEQNSIITEKIYEKYNYEWNNYFVAGFDIDITEHFGIGGKYLLSVNSGSGQVGINTNHFRASAYFIF